MEKTMTTDLYYLALTAVLTIILWIPFIVCKSKSAGPLKSSDYKAPSTPVLPDWVNRANRVHLNSLEVLPSFAALVLVAHVGMQANWITAIACAVFFWSRIAYSAVYWLGTPFIRTVLFTIGVISQLVIFSQIII
jgi:uncharacterized MAPEG superfamily protein